MIVDNQKFSDIEDLSLGIKSNIGINITDYDEFNSQLEDVNETIENVNT